MAWMLTIEKTNNGYILSADFNQDDTITHKVIEEDDFDEFSELEATQKLLLEVKEFFGVYNSKHNKKNLIIDIVENTYE